MSNILRVCWTLRPLTAPRPWLNCSRCGGTRPFRSSGKVRLNANGKRLDAWLIYKCCDCDGTWNRPLFERRNVRELDPDTLGALETSAPEWVERWAFDLADLKRSAARVEHSLMFASRNEPPLSRARRGLPSQSCSRSLPRWRFAWTDLLSSGLGLSRTRVERLHEAGRLCVFPLRRHPLRSPVTDGLRIDHRHFRRGRPSDRHGRDRSDPRIPPADGRSVGREGRRSRGALETQFGTPLPGSGGNAAFLFSVS